MVKFRGVLEKLSQKHLSLEIAELLLLSWSMPARTQILVEGEGMGNVTNFDHHCTPSANTNISTKKVLPYSQREEREEGWEEGNEFIHSWPSHNIQISSEENIFFPSTSARIHISKPYHAGCNGMESIELMWLPSGFHKGKHCYDSIMPYIWSLSPENIISSTV